jgi:hypothetical protein
MCHSIKHCGPLVDRWLVRSYHSLNFLRYSEERRRSERLRCRRRSSVLLEIVAELLDIVCEDLAYISIDERMRNNSRAIDHLSVWRHGVSEKGGSNSSRALCLRCQNVFICLAELNAEGAGSFAARPFACAEFRPRPSRPD